MSPIDYNALKTGSISVENPDDGDHIARLDRAAIVSTQNGERLVTEWSEANGKAEWTSWNRFDETGLIYTIAVLDGLGIDRSQIADDDQFEDALNNAVDHMFDVKTSSQMGSKGDRVFVTTYVNGPAQGVQEQIDVEVPIASEGLPAPGGTRQAAVQEEEPLPF